MTKERNSNIELLRCIFMFLIVFMHLLSHGLNNEFGQFVGNPIYSTTLFEAFFLIFCQIGVDGYVLISGFYGIKFLNIETKKINFSKLGKNYLPIFVYSVLAALVLFFLHQINLKTFCLSFLPVLTVKWWFASGYIFLVLLSPFLNEIVEKFGKSVYLLFCLFLFLGLTYIFEEKVIIQSILGFHSLGFSQLVICYLIGGMINKNFDYIKLKFKPYLCLIFFFGICILLFICTLVIYKITGINKWWRISTNSCPLTVLASIFLFLFFLQKGNYSNKVINFISSLTFGIYLLHTHPLLIKYIYNFVYWGGEYLLV